MVLGARPSSSTHQCDCHCPDDCCTAARCTVCIVSSVIVDCSRATGTLGFTGFRHGAAATKGQVAANIRGTPVSRRTSRRQRQEKNRRWCAQRNASARRLVCVCSCSHCAKTGTVVRFDCLSASHARLGVCLGSATAVRGLFDVRSSQGSAAQPPTRTLPWQSFVPLVSLPGRWGSLAMIVVTGETLPGRRRPRFYGPIF